MAQTRRWTCSPDGARIRAVSIVAAGLGAALAARAHGFDVVPASASGEIVPPSEAAATATIVDSIERTVEAAHSTGAGPALRDAHAKAHGCVKAEFRVAPNVPAALRHGVFGRPATYVAWIRFSNGNGTPHDDHAGDGRGMAIKLVGVVGPKLLTDDPEKNTQDFVMINYPVFFVRNAADYVEFTRLSTENKSDLFFNAHPHESAISHAITSTTVNQVFEQRYFSMTPYRLGTTDMKFSALPVDCVGGARIAPSTAPPPVGNSNYLREAMAERLSRADACFSFAIQPRTDPAGMPIEDPTVVWAEDKAPFVPAAFIRIPRQRFTSPAELAFCENLSFTPWHSLADQRPIGGINRIRRAVYQAISELRHRLNGAPRQEPSGSEVFE